MPFLVSYVSHFAIKERIRFVITISFWSRILYSLSAVVANHHVHWLHMERSASISLIGGAADRASVISFIHTRTCIPPRVSLGLPESCCTHARSVIIASQKSPCIMGTHMCRASVCRESFATASPDGARVRIMEAGRITCRLSYYEAVRIIRFAHQQLGIRIRPADRLTTGPLNSRRWACWQPEVVRTH